MMNRVLAVAGALVMVGALATTAFAAGPKLKASPSTFDPGNACDDQAAWVAKQGLPDAGNANHALVLKKGCPTATNAAALAAIEGVQGMTVGPATQLGYEIKSDSPCGGGAPRFNVRWTHPSLTGTQFSFVGGCANDAERTTTSGWTHVRLELNDPSEAFPVIPAGATIQSVTLLVDEQGTYVLDNIYVDGVTIGKPGATD